MWSVADRHGEEVVGVALVGHPARMLMHDTLCVLRVAAIEGNPNACTILYGACSKAARGMGCENLLTYTHLDESGHTLKAAGWVDDGVTDGGEWDRPARQRSLAIDAAKKRRWFAPWSARANRRFQKSHNEGPTRRQPWPDGSNASPAPKVRS